MRQFTLATSVAALLVASAGSSPSFARGAKKETGTVVPAALNQQFDWENKVVGPKEGLDHDKVAATRDRGIREEEERKKEVPKKVKRSVAEPSTAAIPTQDIEKPATPVEHKKKVAAAAPRQRDALDNLLDEQGVKPNNPTSGTHNSGLDSVLASSDDKPAPRGARKVAKKSRGRRRN